MKIIRKREVEREIEGETGHGRKKEQRQESKDVKLEWDKTTVKYVGVGGNQEQKI